MKQQFGFAALLCLLAGGGLLLAQNPQPPSNPVPSFRAEVEYVEVDAVVTDRTGRFIRDLKQDEFQVFEDGKRQPLTGFSIVDIPVERAERPLFATQPIDPDVQSNERAFDGRIYVMVLDDLHVAPLRSQRVRIAARQFIERNLGANDLMAVVFTGGRAQDAQEFTNNKRLLIASVEKFLGQKLQSATLNRNNEYYRQQAGAFQDTRIPDPQEMQRQQNTRSMLASLTKVSDWFGGVRGRRKAMLLFTEGLDYDLTDMGAFNTPASYTTSLMGDIRDAISATSRSNVAIYAIDPRGLTMQGDDLIEVQSFANTDGISAAGFGNELRWAQDSLRRFADETGGLAVVNRNDFATAFDRIVEDNSSYYVLAYTSPSTKRDGKYHTIQVKTTRPDVTVRSRRGYTAARGKTTPAKTGGMPAEIFEALNSPLQVTGLTLRAFATPFKGTAPNASVLVGLEMLGRDLTLEGGKVDVSFMAIDSKSKVYGARNDTITLTLRPESIPRVAQTGIRALNRVDLPPGRYQLRLAARDQGKSLVGSVIYDLDVPDFYKEPFSISGLAITSSGSAMMTAKADDQMRTVLPAPPVAQRSFAQNDELALFAEVYDNSGKGSHKVTIATSIITDEGRVLFKSDETRDASELEGSKGGFGYATRIPLSGIAPGSYVLNVEARSTLRTDQPVVRQVQIKVVPPVARAQP